MFKNVTIIGGGVLGSQIGLMCAYTGHKTTFWLRMESSIGRTKPKLQRYSSLMLQDLAAAKKLIGNPMGAYLYPRGLIRAEEWAGITPEKIDSLYEAGEKNLKENISITLDMKEALQDADIVIESMSEDVQQKTDIFQKMKDLLPEKTILCTNSSTLLPSMFAQATGRPEKFLALHFANDIWKHNTAEVMGHAGTDPEVFKKVLAFAQDINMIPLPVLKEQPGYILNSMLVPFLISAQKLWAGGVSDPKTIDLTWKLGTGAPMGPFEILDTIGLETAYNIGIMNPEAKDPSSLQSKINAMLKEKIDRGETGINSGKGFYDYKK